MKLCGMDTGKLKCAYIFIPQARETTVDASTYGFHETHKQKYIAQFGNEYQNVSVFQQENA